MNELVKNEDEQVKREVTHHDDPDLDQEEGEYSDLSMVHADTKVWLVKVPKFLADKWNTVDTDGYDLGSVRIYEAASGQDAKISVILPDDELTSDLPKEYNLTVTNKEVRNTLVFAEQKRGEKRKVMSLAGTIHHECIVQPVYNDAYRAIMRKRQKAAITPKRSVQMISTGANLFQPGTMAYGVPSSTKGGLAFNDFLTKKPSKVGATEQNKAARIPRNELLDMLFRNFEQYPYWTLKGLREQTRQPEQYLREVLHDIAILNKKGPYNAMYELKPEYKKANRGSATTSSSTKANLTISGNNENHEEDDDEEDEEMEEVHVD